MRPPGQPPEADGPWGQAAAWPAGKRPRPSRRQHGFWISGRGTCLLCSRKGACLSARESGVGVGDTVTRDSHRFLLGERSEWILCPVPPCNRAQGPSLEITPPRGPKSAQVMPAASGLAWATGWRNRGTQDPVRLRWPAVGCAPFFPLQS